MRTALALALFMPSVALAFCGFYVGSADDALVNNATQVVLLRHGDTTVLSMQNDYQGPPKGFALVVPVPVVLKEADVKTLPRGVFARVDRLAAPRLVEYWEQDPCFRPSTGIGGLGMRGSGSGGGGYGRGSGLGARPQVRIEAQFAVGEYDIVILGADDSAALDAWLRAHQYNIPAGAEAALRPYVASGMKFFVAKVNPAKVEFTDGRAVLSPLRVAYQSKDLRLPVRLGLLNAGGKQDLVVHILAQGQRYQAANYPNVTIPTNLDVTDAVRDRFGEFYAALFDATLAKNPGAVVTEYAWQAGKCDPCPGPVISARDLATLGGDVARELTAPAATGVRVRTAKVTVSGGLERDIVRRVVRRHLSAVRYCVERELARRPQAVDGEYAVRFQVGARGEVTGVKTTAALPGALAQKCLEKRFARMRFPKASGDPAVVDVRLQLRPGPPRSARGRNAVNGWVLTRLHHRYDAKGLGEDLVFAPAEPIVGGREIRRPAPPKAAPKPAPPPPKKAPAPPVEGELAKVLGTLGAPGGVGDGGRLGGGGLGLGTGLTGFGPSAGGTQDQLEAGATPAGQNNFQARYAIRHVWAGAVECEDPVFGRWGGNPKGASGPRSAAGMAPVDRAAIQLSQVLPLGVPELGLKPAP